MYFITNGQKKNIFLENFDFESFLLPERESNLIELEFCRYTLPVVDNVLENAYI